MSTVQVPDLCQSCDHFISSDHDCKCGIFLEYNKFVIECDEYEEASLSADEEK